MKNVVNVAVVGAGAAGLCALRLLARHTNNATNTTYKASAFEQSTHVGGTWFYTDCVGTDEQGLPVHSSMYKSLRTNLPKECMSFPDHPFPSNLPSYVSHEDVQTYLEDYATHFNLWKLIKFQTIVENIKPVPDEDNKFGVRWEVTTAGVANRTEKHTEMFDAVLVCNGHFAKPLMPNIPGLEKYEGHLLHSHNYRRSDAYHDKTVVVLGAQSSGQDISVEVAKVATQVYLSHCKPKLKTFLPSNLAQKPGIKCCHKKVVEFTDGSALEVDAIILCTGYEYDLSFLDESTGIKVEDERVTPLFQHMVSIKYPSLSLVGILKTVLPLPLFHTQILYFRSILDGTGTLPSQKEMEADEEETFSRLKAKGYPARYTHVLADTQFDYLRHLASLGHFDKLPPIFEDIYKAAHAYRRANMTTYRSLNFVVDKDSGEFKVVGDSKTT